MSTQRTSGTLPETEERWMLSPTSDDAISVILQTGDRVYVSAEDSDLLRTLSWTRDQDGYAVSRISGRLVRLHRLVAQRAGQIEADSLAMVDHVNNNRLDNRRGNLRPASAAQNSANRDKQKGTSSAYYGVSYNAKRKRWVAQIMKDHKKKWIGAYETEMEAAQAYNIIAVQYGEFHKLNKLD